MQGADHFLTAEFERSVSVWSLNERSRLSTFETVLSFGGRRLALCDAGGPIVVAAAWERHGVCAYEALTGEQVWQRKDLKKAQQLTPAGAGELVVICLDDRPMHVLDAASGETLAQLRGVRHFAQSPFGQLGVSALSRVVSLVDTRSWQPEWRAPYHGFAVLDFALAPHGVLASDTSEGTARLYAFDLAGGPLWQWANPPGTNCRRLTWDDAGGEWVGVLHHVNHRHADTLIRWSRDGRVTTLVPLDLFVEFEFLPAGGFLVTADTNAGEVRNGASGRAIWTFSEAAP